MSVAVVDFLIIFLTINEVNADLARGTSARENFLSMIWGITIRLSLQCCRAGLSSRQRLRLLDLSIHFCEKTSLSLYV